MPSFHKSLPRFRAFAIVTALALACFATPATTTETASIVIDAESGAILHGEAIDRAAHPASLAKMMTLYLTFEALKGRAFRAHTRLKTSARAARQRPSRLGLRRGRWSPISTCPQANTMESNTITFESPYKPAFAIETPV